MGVRVATESNAAEILSDRRVVIFTGAFGSGKTEIALNYALLARGAGRDVAIVDLDIVNPYFRSQDHRAALAALGIGVIAQEASALGSELPALSREIGGALGDADSHVVVDVGGDPEGATALASLRHHLGEEPDIWMVLNASRPATATAEQMAEMARRIEAMARLRATAVVSNTHLGRETTPQVIAAGHEVVKAAARILELPVRFAAAPAGLAAELEGLGVPILPLRRMVRPPWEPADG